MTITQEVKTQMKSLELKISSLNARLARLESGQRQGKTLDKFQFVTNDHQDFPLHGGGKVIFSREMLVKKIASLVLEKNHDEGFESYYWRAPAGSGKTVFLKLMGRELQSRGCDVYMMDSIRMDLLDLGYFTFLAQQSGSKTMVLLIDDVQDNMNSKHWVDLLKRQKLPNLLVLGVGTTKSAPQFYKRLPEHGDACPMFFTVDDLPELITHFRQTRPKLEHFTTEVCKYVLTFTGGHPFPFIKFVDHLLDDRRHVDLENLDKYISSERFRTSEVYETVRERCFRSWDAEYTVNKDMSFLLIKDNHWYDIWRCSYFMSPLMVSEVFLKYKVPISNEALVLDHSQTTPYEQQVISAGLREMTEEHFRDADYDVDAIGFRWAFNVKAVLPSVWLAPQHRRLYEERQGPGGKPVIGFFLDSLDMGIEMVLNTNMKSLEEHVKQFENVKNCVLFHVDTENESPQVGKWEGKMPAVYTFLKKRNELYCHSRLVQSNVSKRLPSPPARSYCTLTAGCLKVILKRLK